MLNIIPIEINNVIIHTHTLKVDMTCIYIFSRFYSFALIKVEFFVSVILKIKFRNLSDTKWNE